jgi:hypothetical protein
MDITADRVNKQRPFERIVMFLAKRLIRLTVILAIWQVTCSGGRQRFCFVATLGLRAVPLLAGVLGALVQVWQGVLALPGIARQPRLTLHISRQDKGNPAVTRILRPRKNSSDHAAPEDFWRSAATGLTNPEGWSLPKPTRDTATLISGFWKDIL